MLMLILVLVLVLGYQKWHVLGMASLHGEEDFMLGPKMRSFQSAFEYEQEHLFSEHEHVTTNPKQGNSCHSNTGRRGGNNLLVLLGAWINGCCVRTGFRVGFNIGFCVLICVLICGGIKPAVDSGKYQEGQDG